MPTFVSKFGTGDRDPVAELRWSPHPLPVGAVDSLSLHLPNNVTITTARTMLRSMNTSIHPALYTVPGVRLDISVEHMKSEK